MHLDLAELRRRLAARSPLEFAVYGDDGVGRVGTTAAAVLIPVIAQAQGLTVLFTQRTQHLKSHSGQVSFPGGRIEADDAGRGRAGTVCDALDRKVAGRQGL